MNWIRGFFSALVLAVVIAFSGVLPTAPAFAQQIVVEGGSGVTAESLKPFFRARIRLQCSAAWTT